MRMFHKQFKYWDSISGKRNIPVATNMDIKSRRSMKLYQVAASVETTARRIPAKKRSSSESGDRNECTTFLMSVIHHDGIRWWEH